MAWKYKKSLDVGWLLLNKRQGICSSFYYFLECLFFESDIDLPFLILVNSCSSLFKFALCNFLQKLTVVLPFTDGAPFLGSNTYGATALEVLHESGWLFLYPKQEEL